MEQGQFRIHGFFDLQKSLASTPSNSNKDVVIVGRILNSVKDESGERPIIAEMNWDLFDRRGFVKYEHDPVTMQKTANGMVAVTVPNPKNNIGVPLERKVISDKEVLMKATLFPELEYTQDLIKLAKALDEHNRRYPNKKRTLGFSIEGGYLKKSKDGRYAGWVQNVVISPQPQDESTYVRFVEQENAVMAKSMEAGYAVNPADMTGGGALKRESITGTNTSTNQKGKPMFKNRDEAYSHFVKECKGNKEEALKKTNAYFEDVMQKRQTEADNMQKSLNAGIEKIRKSVEAFGTIVSDVAKKQEEVTDFDLSLKKSLKAISANDGEFDGVKFLSEQGQMMVAFGTNLNDQQTAMAKSLALMAEGLAETLTLLKSVHDTATQALIASEDAEEVSRKVYRGMQLAKSGFTTSVNGIRVDAEPAQTKSPADMFKSVGKQAIEAFLTRRGVQTEGTAQSREYFQAQSLVMANKDAGLARMNKSIYQELVEHFAPKVQTEE